VPPQQELQPDSPQEEEPFEIVVTVPVGEDSQEAQPMPQYHDHDQQEEEDNEKEEEGGNKAEGEEDEDYTPWSNAEMDETFHDADEIKTFGSREFHALTEKSTRQSWRSSVDPMCSADTRD
jgi:hypothetical protein